VVSLDNGAVDLADTLNTIEASLKYAVPTALLQNGRGDTYARAQELLHSYSEQTEEDLFSYIGLPQENYSTGLNNVVDAVLEDQPFHTTHVAYVHEYVDLHKQNREMVLLFFDNINPEYDRDLLRETIEDAAHDYLHSIGYSKDNRSMVVALEGKILAKQTHLKSGIFAQPSENAWYLPTEMETGTMN